MEIDVWSDDGDMYSYCIKVVFYHLYANCLATDNEMIRDGTKLQFMQMSLCVAN